MSTSRSARDEGVGCLVAAHGVRHAFMVVGELETVTRDSPAVGTIVLSNRGHGWIGAGQKFGFGERDHPAETPRSDHAAAHRVRSWRIEDSRELAAAPAAAVAHDGPTLVDIVGRPPRGAAAPASERIA